MPNKPIQPIRSCLRHSPLSHQNLLLSSPLRRNHMSQQPLFAPRRLAFNSKFKVVAMTLRAYFMYLTNLFSILTCSTIQYLLICMAGQSTWVEAGATLGVHGFPKRVCPTVGIGSHISGAGYGNMVRKYGLSMDHAVDAKIVDVKDKILDKNGMGEDLFWAIRRGEGASFGAILALQNQASLCS
ncbi:berberine bridge enzyme-like 21 [Durio zibethinus]|uniref:Berberine bridge enzyme-like 21 n=1 Tax=Durio zibethinus TaxID=66656 RepID=A0A6P5WL80_DURZI|nr:berberine bridge enzyme-like 21 [Durio zibethinus]